MDCTNMNKCDDISTSLERLKYTLVNDVQVHMLSSQATESETRHVVGTKSTSKCDVLRLIEEAVSTVVGDIATNKGPVLSYASTAAWKDISFERHVGLEQTTQRYTTVRFESLPSVKKFGLMMKVMSIIYRLVKTDRYCTKRDIYYQEPEMFGNQHILDGIVDNISCMLLVPRWELHILATSKGCVAGDLVFQDADNNYIDCRHTQMGVQVPNHVDGIHNLNTSANFILVVEKDATFQKLLDSRMCEKLHPCIMVTGKGFPDMNTRMLLRKLWDSFAIPILALVDADPHGIEIMAIYRFGSRSLSFETNHLAVPCMRWLGILPSDIQRLGVPPEGQIPLTKADTDKCKELLGRPYMQHYPQWKREVEELLSMDRKAEIQALDAISSSFLCDVYIPNKIRCEGWI